MFHSVLVVLALSTSTYGWVPTAPTSPRAPASALAMVDLANGAMSFDRVCREWRCKYEGDKSDSKSLEAISGVVDEYLADIKAVSPGATVNRLVCGSCLDFKLMTTVPLEDFGKWEENEFAPEKAFLDKIKAIPGVSQVETQTITNMEI